MIRVDPRAIAEVIYNLIENAAKYSPAGTEISITASSDASSVSISVHDEGKGIPPGMRERVFEKFVRLDGETAEGLGLGLAIARGIVESQNGEIKMDAGSGGRGTKVSLRLPIGEE
jgi:K+-sensing histidine kinase KdpD